MVRCGIGNKSIRAEAREGDVSCTDGVVECTPFGVDDHLSAFGSDGRVLQFGDVLDLLDIGAVRPCAEDSTKNTSTSLIRSG